MNFGTYHLAHGLSFVAVLIPPFPYWQLYGSCEVSYVLYCTLTFPSTPPLNTCYGTVPAIRIESLQAPGFSSLVHS